MRLAHIHLLTCALLALIIGSIGSAGSARAQEVLITEFMASNNATLADDDGDFSDWVELHNPGGAPVSLNGWFLTDNASNTVKWRFPDVTIPPYGFLIVFASDKNRRDPTKPLHTSFALSAGGEYLGLIKPDGLTVASEYAPQFPAQQTNVSYGMLFDGNNETLVAPGAPVRAIVPQTGGLGTSWIAPGFDDSGWTPGTTGVGYERGSGYESLIGLDLESGMYNRNPTAYLRIPFQCDDPALASRLTLRLKYDDGFVAYLNGQRVASANAPGTLTNTSSATEIHDDSLALQFIDYPLSSDALVSGTNVLAIHGMNASSGSSDFLILPEVTAFIGQGPLPDQKQFLPFPTPGAPNTQIASVGPRISEVTHTPSVLTAGTNLQVTARVEVASAAIASVSMEYRVNYGPSTTIPMLDDGAHGDGAAGDGIFGAAIPSGAYSSGQMVRYLIRARDVSDRTSRMPLFTNPGSQPEYFGTMVTDPSVVTPLPVLYWFVSDPNAATTEAGTRSSIFYNGEFYDNIFTRLRGNTSIYWPKKNFKFDMNTGAFFQYDPNEDRVEEFNLQSTYSDKTYMRQVLSWETYRDAGAPGSHAFHMRVQQNGAFHSVAEWVEQPDERMLERVGLNPTGALYKMENGVTDAYWAVEKKTRQFENNSDLEALISNITRTGTGLTNYLFDNVNVPAVINYIAATTVIHDNDHVVKNYYLYRDSEGSGEWMFLPWDKDLTFGRNFTLEGGVLNDTMWADNDPYSHPLFGDRNRQKVDGLWNRLIDAIYREPTIRAMYLQRLRTVMEDLLQPPGTPEASQKLERRSNEIVSLIAVDAERDRQQWPTYGQPQNLSTAVQILKTNYLPRRRNHLFVTHGGPGKLIPPAPAVIPALRFGQMDRTPASGNEDEQFIQITNPTSTAVDVSGWTLTGDVTYTFRPGAVIPANGSVYVAASVNAFRARATSPQGGQGLFIQGDFDGCLSETAGPLLLRTASGALVDVIGFTLPDAVSALNIAAGLSEATADDTAALNTETGGESTATVDLADVLRILRLVNGL